MAHMLAAELGRLAVLSQADSAAVDTLELQVCTVPARYPIMSGHDRLKRVHFVLSGWAARHNDVRDGGRQITAILLPGNSCNLQDAVLDGVEHKITALTDTEIGSVRLDQLRDLINRSPTLAKTLWSLTMLDEAVLRCWMVNLGRRNGEARVAHLICELQVRLSRLGLCDGDSLPLPLSQEVIGDTVGLTSVHVNRMMRSLRESGLIAPRQGHVDILDLAGLRRVAEFNDKYLHTVASSKGEC